MYLNFFELRNCDELEEYLVILHSLKYITILQNRKDFLKFKLRIVMRFMWIILNTINIDILNLTYLKTIESTIKVDFIAQR